MATMHLGAKAAATLRAVHGRLRRLGQLHRPRTARGAFALWTARLSTGDAAAGAAVVVATVLVYGAGLAGRAIDIELDTSLFYYPLSRWLAAQLHAGVFPLWLSGIYTGYPLFADGEMGQFSLPQVVALLALPTDLAIGWLRFLHVSAAGLFELYFLRRVVRLGAVPALAGALIFSLGSFFTGQIAHENVVRSAVWLPLILTCIDAALHAAGRRRWGWAALGALTFAQSALGVHVQPVLMSALAVGWYLVLEGATHFARRGTWLASVAVPATIAFVTLAGGLMLAAVQWLPLAEWAAISYRAGGVSYDFASAFPLVPHVLAPAVLFPYFFRLPEHLPGGSVWWTPWHPWEIALYVGVPGLFLMLLAPLAGRRWHLAFFASLGVLALWIGLADYAPLLNLHRLLWLTPGFSFLRAPGRFSYLVVFAASGAAALGLQAFGRPDLRRWEVARLALLPAGATLVIALSALPLFRAWLFTDPARTATWLAKTYLSLRSQTPLALETVRQGLLTSLRVDNPWTAWGLLLLALTCVGFALRAVAAQEHRIKRLQQVMALLLAVDLTVFAASFHERVSLVSLDAPPVASTVAGDRLFVRDTDPTWPFEPNALVPLGLQTVGGYSSLPSQDHVELLDYAQRILEVAGLTGASLIVEPMAPADLRTAAGVQFRTDHPLATGYASAVRFHVAGADGAQEMATVRLVGSFGPLWQSAPDAPVARLSAEDQRGERITIDVPVGAALPYATVYMPSSRLLLRRPEDSSRTATREPALLARERFSAPLYMVDVPLPTGLIVKSLAVLPVDPLEPVQVHGIGLVSANGTVRSLALADREDMVAIAAVTGYVLLRDLRAPPRAFVAPETAAVFEEERPGQSFLQILTGPSFDLRNNFLLVGAPLPEAVGPERSEPIVAGAVAGAAFTRSRALRAVDVSNLGPNVLRVIADADEPSYLVLAEFLHPGWRATVDGEPTPIYAANGLFRAVPLAVGRHVVEMRFAPLSLRVGGAMSCMAALAVLVLMGVGFAEERCFAWGWGLVRHVAGLAAAVRPFVPRAGRWVSRALWVGLLALPLPEFNFSVPVTVPFFSRTPAPVGVVICVAAVLLWNVSTRRYPSLPFPRLLGSCAVVVSAAAVMGIARAASPPLAMQAALQITSLAALCLTIARDPRSPTLAGSVLVLTGLAQGAIAVAQYIHQGPVGLGWLGEIATYDDLPGPWVRGYGLQAQPNPLGGLAMLALIALFGLTARRAWSSGPQRILPPGAVHVAAAAVLVSAVLVSFSRSAWLGAAAGLLAMCVVARPESAGRKVSLNAVGKRDEDKEGGVFRRRVVQTAACGTLVLAVFALTSGGRMATRVVDAFGVGRAQAWRPPERTVAENRLSQFSAAAALIRLRPFSGVGAGNFALAWSLIDQERSPYADFLPVHSVPVLVAAELGIAAGAALCLALAACMVKIAARLRQGGRQFAIWSGIFVSALVPALLDNYPWTLFLWIVLGCWQAALAQEASGAARPPDWTAGDGLEKAAGRRQVGVPVAGGVLSRRAAALALPAALLLSEVARRRGAEQSAWPVPRDLTFRDFRALCQTTAQLNRRDGDFVVPSPVDWRESRMRDAFWTIAAIGDWRLGQRLWHRFARGQLPTGQVPTSIVARSGATQLVSDDESTLLFILQGLQILRSGRSVDPIALSKAGTYVLRHVDNAGRYASASGAGQWWADTYISPRGGTFSYTQGLLCAALLALKEIRLDQPNDVFDSATATYAQAHKAATEPLTITGEADYLDVSCLVGEYLAQQMFDRTLLPTKKVVATLDRFARSRTPDGSFAGFRILTDAAGNYLAQEQFTDASENLPGHYHNGGSWLLFDAIALAVGLRHDYDGAVDLLRERVFAETRRDSVLHAYIVTDNLSPSFGSTPDTRRTSYAWNAYVERILDEAKLW